VARAPGQAQAGVGNRGEGHFIALAGGHAARALGGHNDLVQARDQFHLVLRGQPPEVLALDQVGRVIAGDELPGLRATCIVGGCHQVQGDALTLGQALCAGALGAAGFADDAVVGIQPDHAQPAPVQAGGNFRQGRQLAAAIRPGGWKAHRSRAQLDGFGFDAARQLCFQAQGVGHHGALDGLAFDRSLSWAQATTKAVKATDSSSGVV
jgi:hypothetical protein